MSSSPTLNSYCASCDEYFEFHKCNAGITQYDLAAIIDDSPLSLNVIWESDEDSDDESLDEFYSDVEESDDEESDAIVQKYSTATAPCARSLATIIESEEENEDTCPHVDDFEECDDSVNTTHKPLRVSQQPTLDSILECDEEDDNSEVNSPHPSYVAECELEESVSATQKLLVRVSRKPILDTVMESDEEEDDTPLYMGITSTSPIAVTVSVTVSVSYSCP